MKIRSVWTYVRETYNFSFLNIVEKNKVTKHGDKAEKTKTSNNIDNSVLKIKLSYKDFKDLKI